MKKHYRYDHAKRAWQGSVMYGDKPSFTNVWFVACIQCGDVASGQHYPRLRCDACRRERRDEINRVTGRAHARVQLAIKAGTLPELDGSVQCTDCDKPARVYDHREYAKPLVVDPVCYSCNTLRGPAIDAPFVSEKIEWKLRA